MRPAIDPKHTVEEILDSADVHINGSRPWDLVVHDDRFYPRVLSSGALGLGESYMDGWWDCAELANFFFRILKSHLDARITFNWSRIVAFLKAVIANRQARSRSPGNVHTHYDLGDDLYCSMLGRWMLYSSANWSTAKTLDEAGEAKLDFVCRKLDLRPGQTLLDIGCGWGGFAKFASLNYGVRVLGITLSDDQVRLARRRCADLPVEIRRLDYRDIRGQFDHIVSLGMFEHVGYKNYRRYMQIVHCSLKPGGRFFLNTIGNNKSSHSADPWTDKYIFPGGMLPSIAQIASAIDGLFVMDELQDWADHYDRTLIAWFEKFTANWNKLKSHYGDRFFRMWTYYLLSSAGAFRSKAIHDWQIVFSTRAT